MCRGPKASLRREVTLRLFPKCFGNVSSVLKDGEFGGRLSASLPVLSSRFSVLGSRRVNGHTDKARTSFRQELGTENSAAATATNLRRASSGDDGGCGLRS